MDKLLFVVIAILRSRCGRRNVSYATVSQILPDLPAASYRSRITRLTRHTSEAAYLERLTVAWDAMWKEHRGEPDLPDKAPYIDSEFDLEKHVAYLRSHIDKHEM